MEIRFTYDLNGILEVEATVAATKKTSSIVIDRSRGGMSQGELDQARKAMKRLKFHPRDSLPNRTALARADALHAELTGVERDILARGIQSLRLALESQDPSSIDHLRTALNTLIDQLKR